MIQRQSISDIRSTLHRLWSQLPAIKDRCTDEVLQQHLKLIAYYQAQYDRLIEASHASNSISGELAQA